LTQEDFALNKNSESRSRSDSIRETSANIKRVKKNTNRALNNKSMNADHEIFKEKYQTISKPQTQRVAQRSYIKGDVPIKDNSRKSNLDRTHDLIKSDLAQTFTSPARYHNSIRPKTSNRFNLNLSAVRKVSLNQTKLNPTTKKTDRQRMNTTYVNPSLNYKEDSFIESGKKNRKKPINGILQGTLSPHTDDKKSNKAKVKTGSFLNM